MFEIFSKFSRQIFRDIIDEKIEKMFKKRKAVVQMKIVKEKKMHVKLIKFNFIELIYLEEIVVRVGFFRLIYVVVCFMINMSINDVKIKTLFDNDVEINCISKKLIDATQFFIR